MIRRDIQQDSNVWLEGLRSVELVAADLKHVPVVVLLHYLTSHAEADITRETYIVPRLLHQMIRKQRSGSLTVGTGNRDHFCVGVLESELDLVYHRYIQRRNFL